MPSTTPPPLPRVLLVEDDLKLANLVQEYLQANGLQVDVEGRGDIAARRILDEQPDLVILDLMLPGMDGLNVCRAVRESYANPILMLTARADEIDEVLGLEIGADDYMAKPVRPRLLLARIHALLRRNQRTEAAEDAAQTAKHVDVGTISIDAANRVVLVMGAEVELTTAEFDLLWLLATHPGEVLPREQIYQDLRGIEWDGLDRSIDLRVARLRKKLGDDAKHPRLIKSVRGAGYLLVVDA